MRAEQLCERQLGPLGLQVPQRDIEGAEGLRGHAAAPDRSAGPAQLVPQAGDVVGVFADQRRRDFARMREQARPAGPGIRLDSGVYDGWTVPVDYDPLLAKLAVWAETRDLAANRMARALREYSISGITTNIAFFVDLLADPEFRAGNLHTGFLDGFFLRRPRPLPDAEVEAVAAIAAALSQPRLSPATATPPSRWKLEGRHR